MPIYCCPFHMDWPRSSETYTHMKPSEPAPSTQPEKFSSVQQDYVCNCWGKKKKKEKLPGEGKCIFGLWARILATRIQPLNCRRVDNSGIVRDDCFQLWELHSETFEVYIRGHSMGASGWVKTQVSNELWSPTLCLHWGGRAPAPITLMQRLTASTHRAVLVTNAKSRFCFTET